MKTGEQKNPTGVLIHGGCPKPDKYLIHITAYSLVTVTLSAIFVL